MRSSLMLVTNRRAESLARRLALDDDNAESYGARRKEGPGPTSAGTVDGDFERYAKLAHPFVAEPPKALGEDADGDALY
jgi:hypothetical protein